MDFNAAHNTPEFSALRNMFGEFSTFCVIEISHWDLEQWWKKKHSNDVFYPSFFQEALVEWCADQGVTPNSVVSFESHLNWGKPGFHIAFVKPPTGYVIEKQSTIDELRKGVKVLARTINELVTWFEQAWAITPKSLWAKAKSLAKKASDEFRFPLTEEVKS